MHLNDDGDLIRGLGYVALYSAYVEEAIDECLECIIANCHNSNKRPHRLPASKKIIFIKECIMAYGSLPDELNRFLEVLMVVSDLLEERNILIHGRIYAVPGAGDIRKSARRDLPEQPANSAELYALANDLSSACGPLYNASMFSLPRLINK